MIACVYWIPAFAGMTALCVAKLLTNSWLTSA